MLVPYLARPYTWFTSGRTGPELLWAAFTVGAFAIVSLRTGVRGRHEARRRWIRRRADFVLA